MSCRWSFEGSLARNAFLRDSRCTKPYVFPYKVRPRTSMIYLCGATGARRSRVWSDHGRIMGGSWSDRFRIVNGVSTVFRARVVDRIPLWFATVGSFPHCKWGCKWCWWMSCRWNSIVICNSRIVPATVNGIASGAGGGVADGVWKEVSHEMRFWEIADARKPMFFHTKCVHELRWSTSAVRRVRDGLVCGRIMFGSCSDLGSCSDRFRIVNGVSTVFRACVVDRIPLWFATVGSFPQCKWDCKWCWWMSCRWNSIVICNCRIVPAMQMALQVVLPDELPMEFWRKSRTKCVFER